MKRLFLAVLTIALCAPCVWAQKASGFDFSSVSVPEEGGVKFERITEDADIVADYSGTYATLVRNLSRSFNAQKTIRLDWWVLPQIALSPDGTRLAYIYQKNNTTNVMVKDAHKGGVSVQRTFCTSVQGVSWSPDGKTLCFTEVRNNHYGVYLVNAEQGSVIRQISNGTDNDLGGVISTNGQTIFFHRVESGKASYSLWSYDLKTNLFSNYSRGMTVCLIPGNTETFYCGRFTDKNEGEIWCINSDTGVEEVVLGIPGRSFSTPQLSPNGKWLLVTGASRAEKEKVYNTDIFVVRTDGTRLTQLTYHPGNDLSPIWSHDGKSIYFLSQRGSANRCYNVWRMDFKVTD